MIPETTDLQTSSPSTSSPIDTRNPVADPTDPNQLMFAQTENNLISGADQEDEAEEANELLSWNKKTEDEIFGNIEKKQFKKAAKNLEYAARFFYNSASAAKLVVKLAEKNPNGVAAAFLDDRMFARSAANIFKQNDKGIKGIHQAAANILVEMFDKNPKKMLGIFNFLNGESMAGILKKMTPRKTAEILLRDEISTMYVAVILSEMMDDENKNKILKEINDLKPEKGTEISEYLEALKKKKDDSEAEENNTFSDLMNKYFSEAKGILQDDKIGYAPKMQMLVTLAEKNFEVLLGIFIGDGLSLRAAAEIFAEDDAIIPIAAKVLGEMGKTQPKKAAQILNRMSICGNQKMIVNILRAMNLDKATLANIFMDGAADFEMAAQIFAEDDAIIPIAAKVLGEMGKTQPKKAAQILNRMSICDKQEMIVNILRAMNLDEATLANIFMDGAADFEMAAQIFVEDGAIIPIAAKVLGEMGKTQPKKAAQILNRMSICDKQEMIVNILRAMNLDKATLANIFMDDAMGFEEVAQIFLEGDTIVPIVAKVLDEMGKTQPKKAAQILNRMSICDKQEMIANIFTGMNLKIVVGILTKNEISNKQILGILCKMYDLNDASHVANILAEIFNKNPKKAARILNAMNSDAAAMVLGEIASDVAAQFLASDRMTSENVAEILGQMCASGQQSKVANILAEIFNKNPKKAARILNAMDSNAAAMVLGEIASDVAAQFLVSNRMSSENVAKILDQMCASGQQSKVANILAETFNKDPKKAARILHKMNDENRNVILTKPDMNPCVEEIRRTLDQWSSDDDPDDLGDAVFRILNALKDKNFSGASAILWDGEMSLDDILSKLQSEKRTELLELLLNDEVNYGDMKGILSHFNEDSYGTAAKALAKINESQPEKGVKILVGMIANEEYVVAAGILDKMSEQISINILANDELEVEELFIIISSMKNWEQTSAILGKIYAMEKHRAKVVKILSFFEASDLDKFLATELLAPHAEDIRQAIEGEELGTLSEDEMSKEGEMKKIVDDATKEKVDAAAVPFAGWAPIILVGLGCGVLGALASFLAIFFIPTLVTMWSVVVCVNLGCAIAASAGIAFYQSRAKNSKNTQDDPTAIA